MLTQEFTFETDDLDDLAAMIRTVCGIVFKHTIEKPGGKYSQLHINTHALKDMSFQNGQDLREYYNARPVLFEDPSDDFGDRVLLLDVGRIQGGAAGMKVVEKLTGGDREASLEKAAEASNPFLERTDPKPLPTRLWVATLGDYKSEMRETDTPCANLDELVMMAKEAARVAKIAKKDEFRKVCGSGYNEWFCSDDGSVDIGWRLEKRGASWPEIDISLTHVYYGK